MTEPAAEPTAVVVPRRRRLGWYWALPLLSVVTVAAVLAVAWSRGGTPLTLHFQDGHGLKPGDALRCRGIVIGEVHDVRLDPDGPGILVKAVLRPEAAEVARTRTRFWIVRPQADLASGLRGLDTVIGARYVMVEPGGGEARTDFIGLEQPPVAETVEAGGLDLVLQTDRLGGLRSGAPVTFRQVRIGSVLRADLASDASAVDVHVYIRPAYARLARQGSKFWNTSGVKVSATLFSGLALEAESAETLLVGGVALATPPDAGPPLRSGTRVRMEVKPDPKWEQWRPPTELTGATPPAGAAPPRPVPATLLYQTPGYLWGRRSYTRRGLVVPVGRHLLGPADLLRCPKGSAGSGTLTLQAEPAATAEVPVGDTAPAAVWLATAGPGIGTAPALRVPGQPEDCLLLGDPARPPWPLSAARLKKVAAGWEIDAALPADSKAPAWHGAAVVAVKDGRVIGLAWAAEKATQVLLLPLDEATARPPAEGKR